MIFIGPMSSMLSSNGPSFIKGGRLRQGLGSSKRSYVQSALGSIDIGMNRRNYLSMHDLSQAVSHPISNNYCDEYGNAVKNSVQMRRSQDTGVSAGPISSTHLL